MRKALSQSLQTQFKLEETTFELPQLKQFARAKLVMDLDFNQFAQLIDIKPDRGSHFIHSMSEPFSEEDIEDEVMHNWLDHFKMQFHQLHASGHMNRQQLIGLINYVKPKKIFPIHTENQQLFKKISKNVQTIRYGRKYRL